MGTSDFEQGYHLSYQISNAHFGETIVNLFAWNIIHKTAEKVIAPIAKAICLSDLTRFYINLVRVWQYVLWKTRLGALGKDTLIYSHVIIHNPENGSKWLGNILNSEGENE